MNSIPLKTVFHREYQRTHYKKSVFSLFADLRLEEELKDGATVQWDYDDDAVADSLDSSDGYTLDSTRVPTAEQITVNQKPSYGFLVPATQRIQDHHPTQQKWAKKSMNVIFQKIDGDVLNDLSVYAGSTIDDSMFGGNSGDPVDVTTSNASAIFAKARTILINNNVLYDENKEFKNDVSLDGGERFPVAAIPAELQEKLLLQVGFKNTDYADKVMKSGYMGPMFGFNAIASTSLPFSFRLSQSAQPTNAKKLFLGSGSTTIGSGTSVSLNWVTTLGSTPGNVLSETDAPTSIANLVDLLNDPYTGVASKSVPFVRANLSRAQKRFLDNVSAVDNEDGTCVIRIRGFGTRIVSTDDANGEIDRKAVHAIFGVSRSIAIIMQRSPSLEESAGNLIPTGQGTGYVGKQFLTWGLYGRKVFKTMQAQLVDVPILADTFAEPASVLN